MCLSLSTITFAADKLSQKVLDARDGVVRVYVLTKDGSGTGSGFGVGRGHKTK